jgi:hypothetical protein
MRPLHNRRRQKGQSLVEFTMIIPVLMTLVLAIAEFGVATGANMTLIEATREGARVGAILVSGANSFGCVGATGSTSVDPQIIAAVQRVIESPGSGINKNNVTSIRIYKADAAGNDTTGFYNEWTLGSGGTICGVALDFAPTTVNWPVTSTSRSNTLPAGSIGVKITYGYGLFTPLSSLAGLFGTGKITMVDQTVMAFEP